jgi:hypothetical protein
MSRCSYRDRFGFKIKIIELDEVETGFIHHNKQQQTYPFWVCHEIVLNISDPEPINCITVALLAITPFITSSLGFHHRHHRTVNSDGINEDSTSLTDVGPTTTACPLQLQQYSKQGHSRCSSFSSFPCVDSACRLVRVGTWRESSRIRPCSRCLTSGGESMVRSMVLQQNLSVI